MDPITDMLNRIRNAQAVSQQTVYVPFSKIKNEITLILEKEKFIGKVEKTAGKNNPQTKRKFLKIALNYNDKFPAISGLKRISKSGQRIYVKAKEIKPVKGSYGISIISTPKGLMTGKEARKKKLGGEIICEVW